MIAVAAVAHNRFRELLKGIHTDFAPAVKKAPGLLVSPLCALSSGELATYDHN